MVEDRKEKNRKQFLSLLKTLSAAFCLMAMVGLFIKYAPSASEDLTDDEGYGLTSNKRIDHSKPNKKSSSSLTSIEKRKYINYHSQPSNKCSINDNKIPCHKITADNQTTNRHMITNQHIIANRHNLDEIDDELIEVYDLIHDGQIEEAIQNLNILIKQNPSNYQAIEELAMVYLNHKNDKEKATSLLEQATSIDPNNDFATYELVELYIEQNDFQKGIDFLEELYSNKSSDSPNLAHNLGDLYLQKGDLDTAISYFEIAQNNSKNSVQVLESLASAHLHKGNIDKATDLWEQAATVSPNNESVTYELTRLYAKKGDYQKGIDFLEDLYNNQDADSSNIALRLGDLYSKKGDMDKAIDFFQKASDNSHNRNNVLPKLASAHLQNGNLDKAVESYEKTISTLQQSITEKTEDGISANYLREDIGQSQLNLAGVLIQLKKYDQAQEVLVAARGNLPHDNYIQKLENQIKSQIGN